MKTKKSLLLKIVLWPLSVIYGMVVGFRNFLFDCGILPSKQFDIPVISVGNLTVGGTGKTPFTEYLIQLLSSEMRVGVLSRGYKRSTSGYQLLSPSSTPTEVGDEPYQMKRKFPQVMFAVDANRRRGIKKMMNEPIGKPDIIILDDAYQHRYVIPEISILLIDYNRMITEDSLLPLGQLREPVKEKNRANAIVVTKCPPDLSDIEFCIIKKNLKMFPYQSLHFTSLKYGELQPLFPNAVTYPLTMEDLKNSYTAMIVTGIASPLPFEDYVRSYVKDRMVSLNFADHHNFSKNDLKKIEDMYNMISAGQKVVVTTEKDAVRLMHSPDFPAELRPFIYYIPLSITFLKEDGEVFDKNLWGYLEKNRHFAKLVSAS